MHVTDLSRALLCAPTARGTRAFAEEGNLQQEEGSTYPELCCLEELPGTANPSCAPVHPPGYSTSLMRCRLQL